MHMQWKLTVGAVLTALALGAQAESFDVVVIGSGGAGLSAGIMAKEAGAKTVVLEKQAYLGGNTNFASGGMNAAGTKQQLAAGVTNDSPEIFFRDTMKGGHNLNNPALLKVFTENAKYSEDGCLISEPTFASARGAAAVSRSRAVTVPATARPSVPKFCAYCSRRPIPSDSTSASRIRSSTSG